MQGKGTYPQKAFFSSNHSSQVRTPVSSNKPESAPPVKMDGKKASKVPATSGFQSLWAGSKKNETKRFQRLTYIDGSYWNTLYVSTGLRSSQ